MATNGSEYTQLAFDHLAKAIALLAQAGGVASAIDSTAPGAFTLDGACDYLSIGETKFRDYVRDGEIPPAFDLAGRPHWSRKDLDKFLTRKMRSRTTK